MAEINPQLDGKSFSSRMRDRNCFLFEFLQDSASWSAADPPQTYAEQAHYKELVEIGKMEWTEEESKQRLQTHIYSLIFFFRK